MRTLLAACLALIAASACQAAEWRQAFTASADGTRITYYVAGEARSDTPPIICAG